MRQTHRSGRDMSQLLADFGHDLPTAAPHAPATKEARLFRHAAQRGPRKTGRGWMPASAPVVPYRMTSDQAPVFWPFNRSARSSMEPSWYVTEGGTSPRITPFSSASPSSAEFTSDMRACTDSESRIASVARVIATSSAGRPSSPPARRFRSSA